MWVWASLHASCEILFFKCCGEYIGRVKGKKTILIYAASEFSPKVGLFYDEASRNMLHMVFISTNLTFDTGNLNNQERCDWLQSSEKMLLSLWDSVEIRIQSNSTSWAAKSEWRFKHVKQYTSKAFKSLVQYNQGISI